MCSSSVTTDSFFDVCSVSRFLTALSICSSVRLSAGAGRPGRGPERRPVERPERGRSRTFPLHALHTQPPPSVHERVSESELLNWAAPRWPFSKRGISPPPQEQVQNVVKRVRAQFCLFFYFWLDSAAARRLWSFISFFFSFISFRCSSCFITPKRETPWERCSVSWAEETTSWW